jgi:hypothetical protein
MGSPSLGEGIRKANPRPPVVGARGFVVWGTSYTESALAPSRCEQSAAIGTYRRAHQHQCRVGCGTLTTFEREYRHKLSPEVTDADDDLGQMWS